MYSKLDIFYTKPIIEYGIIASTSTISHNEIHKSSYTIDYLSLSIGLILITLYIIIGKIEKILKKKEGQKYIQKHINEFNQRHKKENKMEAIVEVMTQGTKCCSCDCSIGGIYGILINERKYCKACGKIIMDDSNEDVVITMKKKPEEIKISELVEDISISSINDREHANKLLNKYVQEGKKVNCIIENEGTFHISYVTLGKTFININDIDSIQIYNNNKEQISLFVRDEENDYIGENGNDGDY